MHGLVAIVDCSLGLSSCKPASCGGPSKRKADQGKKQEGFSGLEFYVK